MKFANIAMALVMTFAGANALAQTNGKSREDAKKEVPSAAARSGGGDYDCPPGGDKSTRSRAELRAEGRGAQASHEYDCPKPEGTSGKSRAEVKSEARAANKAGQIDRGEAGKK